MAKAAVVKTGKLYGMQDQTVKRILIHFKSFGSLAQMTSR